MIDSYFHDFTGTGYETHGAELRSKPMPGWHYYEHSQSTAHAIEELFGIHAGDPLNKKQLSAAKVMVDHYRELFPGGWGGGGNIVSAPPTAGYVGDPSQFLADTWGLL